MGIALEGSPPKWSSGTLSCSSPMPARPITHHSQACSYREWELRETGTRKGPEGPRRDDRSQWILVWMVMKTGKVPKVRVWRDQESFHQGHQPGKNTRKEMPGE